MIDPAKIEKALARIQGQRQQQKVQKVQKIIAEVERNIKSNPFSVAAEFEKLDAIYAEAPKERKALYNEIRTMLAEAISEHTKILLDDAKDFTGEAE